MSQISLTTTVSPAGNMVETFPREGDRLRERFLLVSELGGGRSGVVFLAQDGATGQDVAVKVLRRDHAVRRLRREYGRLRDLAHPHVVSAFELHADGSPKFIVMPYVAGRHLDRAVTRLAPRDRPARARSYFGQLALALHALHRAGIVHRDVKPSNVLVSDDGFVSLIDLGLAVHADERGADLEGTPAFVAPEVLGGHQATAASDWYAFGVMLHQILAGALPFEGTVAEVLRKKRETDPPAPSPAAIILDAELARLAHALLSRSPGERPAPARIFDVLGVTPPPRAPSTDVFLGRDAELGILDALYEDAARGRPRAVEIVGPSGIGKTSLVRAFVERLEARSPRPIVLATECYENEHGAFNALDEVRSFISAEDAAPSIGATLAEGLSRECVDRPIVIVVDQLQFADADSARALADAWPRLADARVLLVLCVRDDQRAESPFVGYVEAHCPELLANKLTLEALGPSASAALVRRLGGDPRDERLDSAAGNPLLLLLMTGDDRSLASLDDDSREVGAWIALAGHPIEQRTLERTAPHVRDFAGTVQRLEKLRWIGKVRHRGAVVLTPAHDWMRTRLASTVDAPRARAMHYALGSALAAHPSPPAEEIAEHYWRARAGGDFLPFAEQAARHARKSRAFASEAIWLERMLEVPELEAGARPAVRRRAALARGDGGYGHEASAHYLTLARETSSEEDGIELRILAAEQLFECGSWDRASTELRASLERLGLSFPTTRRAVLARFLWARVRLRLAALRLDELDAFSPDAELPRRDVLRLRASQIATMAHRAFDPLLGAYFACLHLELTLRSRAADHVLRAVSDELSIVAGGGLASHWQAVPLVAKVRQLLPGARRREDRLYAETILGAVSLQYGRFGEASAQLTASERALAAEADHMTWELTFCRMLLMRAETFHRGLGLFGPSLDRWIADARTRRDEAALRYFVTKRALTELARDDLARARATIAEVRALLIRGKGFIDMDRATLLNTRVLLELYAGRPTRATVLALIAELTAVMRSNLRRVRGLYCVAAALQASLLLTLRAEREDARIARTLERVTRVLAAEPAEYTHGIAFGIAAARAFQSGRRASALDELERSADAYARAGLLPARYATLARIGQLRGGPAGRALTAGAFGELRALEILRPARYARMLTPGFDDFARGSERDAS